MSISPNIKEPKKHQVNAAEFIPYACHYDENTLITKNGELLQTIKITGFNYEAISDDDDGQSIKSIREYIRKAVSESVLTNDIAIWFTTIRRKISIATEGTYKNEFAQGLNEKWNEKNSWNSQFVTELYISVLIQGEKLSIASPKLFIESLNIGLNLKRRREVLENQFAKLSVVTDNILSRLVKFGAKKLGVYKEEGIYYSEMAEFMSKIINLKVQRVKFIPFELSKILPTSTTMFQYNTLEVITDTGKRHLGAIMTIKEYHEIPTSYIDNILQMPVQFIITETLDFIDEEIVLKTFEDQKKIFDLSKDEYAFKASGLYDILQADTEKDTDYGEHQITITILEDSVKELNRSITTLSKEFKDLGIMIVREDIFLEDCYWSQLPGNFDFIKRKSFIPTIWAGGYASLYNFPAGKKTGNHWGDAVTMFYTENHTPYYFNFHVGGSGHTSLIGPKGSGKTVLLNFLLSQSQKYEPRIYYFDYEGCSKVFVNALGGKYYQTTDHAETSDRKDIKFNPLQLDDTPQNREFIKEWFEYLITYVDSQHEFTMLTEDDRLKIKIASDTVFRMPLQNRNLSDVIKSVWGDKSQGGTAERLAVWHSGGEYSNYFSSSLEDGLDITSNDIFGFDLSNIAEKPAVCAPMISYLLNKIELHLDKKFPAIIVLDEAWKLIDNAYFITHLEAWLDRVAEKNAVVIFASESVDDVAQSSITHRLMQKLSTEIYLANDKASDDYKKIFRLTNIEYDVIRKINKNHRKFLLKQDGISVVALLDLTGMEQELAVLSADKQQTAIFDEIFAVTNEGWLNTYKQKIIDAKV